MFPKEVIAPAREVTYSPKIRQKTNRPSEETEEITGQKKYCRLIIESNYAALDANTRGGQWGQLPLSERKIWIRAV